MKIENNGIQPVTPKRIDGISTSKKSAATTQSHSINTGKDRADVTDTARLMAKANAQLDAVAQTETNERVEALKQAIAQNQYEIPYSELAQRLLSRLGSQPTNKAE